MNFLKRILPAFFVLFLVSCSNSFTNKASIVVRMPSNDDARAICENDDIGERHISHFGVEVTQNDKLIQEMPKVLPGKEAVFSDVAEGEYTVTVTAYLIVREEDGTQKTDPVYKGSDTKFVAAGSEPTKFIIKLAKIESETDDDNSDDEKDTIDCPFYVNPIEDTQFHTALCIDSSEKSFVINPLSEKELQEGQYYQLVTETDYDGNYVKAKINLVTPKEGQAPDVELLKDNLFVYGANYLFIMLMDEEENPYIIFTKYTEMLCEENEDFFNRYIELYQNEEDESAYFDFIYPYNAMQISQYMPKAYQALWEDKELRKSDSVFGTDRPYYLNELNEDNLKKIGVARINFIGSSKGEEEIAYITYAMSGNSVSIPGVGYFDYNPEIYAIYSDKDGKNKVSGSITVSAGINNLYIIGEGEEPNPGSPEGGKTCTVKLNCSKELDFSKTGDKYSSPAIDFNAVLLENNISISKGDTIVFTLSGTPDKKIDNLYYQFLYFDSGAYHDYNYSYNYGLPGISFKEDDKFTINLPINYVWAPDSEGNNPVFRAINLFYAGSNGCTVNNCEMSLTVYKSQSDTDHVIEFFKSYDDGSKEYRDECLLKHLPNMPTNNISKNHIVKVTLSAKANQDATFFVNVIDGSQAGGYFRILNGIDDGNNLTEEYGAYGFTVKEGKQTTQTLEIPITRDSYGQGDNQLQFIRELGGDPDFNNALHLENVSIKVELDYVK